MINTRKNWTSEKLRTFHMSAQAGNGILGRGSEISGGVRNGIVIRIIVGVRPIISIICITLSWGLGPRGKFEVVWFYMSV